MATPYRNGIASIVGAAKIIVRMAAAFSSLWGGFLTPADKALVDDLVSCANAVIAALERSEYRP